MKINKKIGSGPNEPYNPNVLYGPDGEVPDGEDVEYIDVRRKYFQDADNQDIEDMQKRLLCMEAISVKGNVTNLGITEYIISTYPGFIVGEGGIDLDDIVAIAWSPRKGKTSENTKGLVDNLTFDINRLDKLPRISEEEYYNIIIEE